MAESGARSLAALTAWQALVETAGDQPGQRVLVHAGSGGVGSVAIQLAKQLGAHVARATSTANVAWFRAPGADEVVDYRRDDFASVLSDYDVVLDSLGGQTLRKSFRLLKPGGIAIGIAGPPDPAFAAELGAGPLARLAHVAAAGPRARWSSRSPPRRCVR